MSSPILVGYERSESADRALTRAIALAHERHAPLLVLAVHEAPVDPTGPRAFGTMGPLYKVGEKALPADFIRNFQ